MRILIAENGMQEMGGFEVARRLKADEALQKIPIDMDVSPFDNSKTKKEGVSSCIFLK